MRFSNHETQRLFLKNISMEDRDFIYEQFSDDDVNQYLFDAEPLTDLQGADEIVNFYIQPEPRHQHRWIIVRKSDGIKLGTCGFHCWNKEKGTIEVGYDLKSNFWGNGYMQEAMNELILFARNNMNLKEIRACIFRDNYRSIRLVEKLGFQFIKSSNEIFREKEYIHHWYVLKF